MSEIKKDLHHIISIIVSAIAVIFLMLQIPPYNEILEVMLFAHTIIIGPIVIIYTFIRMLDYEEEKVYMMIFMLGIIGFFGKFVENEIIFEVVMIPWATAFIYFPMMKYIKFTRDWFEKIDKNNVHVTKMMKIERMARRKYKRRVRVKVLENEGKRVTVAIISPKKNPNYLISEWELLFEKGKINIEEDRWIGERFKK